MSNTQSINVKTKVSDVTFDFTGSGRSSHRIKHEVSHDVLCQELDLCLNFCKRPDV